MVVATSPMSAWTINRNSNQTRLRHFELWLGTHGVACEPPVSRVRIIIKLTSREGHVVTNHRQLDCWNTIFIVIIIGIYGWHHCYFTLLKRVVIIMLWARGNVILPASLLIADKNFCLVIFLMLKFEYSSWGVLVYVDGPFPLNIIMSSMNMASLIYWHWYIFGIKNLRSTCFNIKTVLSGIWLPIIKIRPSWCLII